MKIIENRIKFYALSLLIILFGLGSMMFYNARGEGAFYLDMDFQGGTSITIDLEEDFHTEDVEGIVAGLIDGASVRVQAILGTTQAVIKLPQLDGVDVDDIVDALKEKYPVQNNSVHIQQFSPSISFDMQRKALLALGVVCVFMLLYISVRFRDIRAGSSAIVTLIHDVLIMVAAYAVFRIPVNNYFIAALLTILGYSINATIVIFDRIRENKAKRDNYAWDELMNKSILQTMRRSLYTSLTTLITVLCVYILGVPSIKEFAFPLIIGIISGTYSSICIASNLWYDLLRKTKQII